MAIYFLAASDALTSSVIPGYLRLYTGLSMFLLPVLLFSTNLTEKPAGITPAKFLPVSMFIPLLAETFFGPAISRYFHQYTLKSAIAIFVSYLFLDRDADGP